MRSFGLVRPCNCGRSPIDLAVVTAADRAAATCGRLGNEPLRPPTADTSPFRRGFAGSAAQRLPPQRELSAVRLTEDKRHCWGAYCRSGGVYLPPSAAADGLPPSAEGGEGWQQSCHKLLFRALQARGGGFPIAPATPSAHSLWGLCRTLRWQVAAALSAAVTTTKPIGDAPTSQAEPTMQKQPRQTPAALREKGSGEEGLLSEKPPPPQNPPHPLKSPRLSAIES